MATRHLPIRDLHHTNTTMLPNNPMLASPPDDTPATATTASVAPTSISPSVGSPSPTIQVTPTKNPTAKISSASLAPAVSFTRPPATDPPVSSPLAPHQGNSWDLETPHPGNGARFTSIPITPPRASAQSNTTRRLPPGSVNQNSLTPGRESSPSRLSTISALAGSQLSRVASARHIRSHSTPMGLTGDNRGKHQQQQQRNTSGLFSSIFTPSTRQSSPERQDPPPSSLRAVTPSASALATVMGTPKSGNKGFFNFAFGGSNQPNSPLSSSRSSTRALSPDRDTCLVDEFAGISFRSLLQSYTVEPLGTPETLEEALKRTPEGRLGELSETAGDLLERVYEAYKTRTNALSEVMDQQVENQDLLEESRTKTAEYKLQLERLATEERAAREEQQLRLAAYEKRIRDLEDELYREKAKVQDFEQRAVMANQKKRTSAASDSGFESDADSLFSIRERDRMTSPVGSFLDTGIDETSSSATSTSTITTSTAPAAPLKCDSCAKSLHPVSSSASSIASMRNPTPLSQAWSSSNNTNNSGNNSTSKWGFAAALRGNRQTGVWGGSDAEIVRQENRMLRARVGELEAVVDDVLEVVAGRGVF